MQLLKACRRRRHMQRGHLRLRPPPAQRRGHHHAVPKGRGRGDGHAQNGLPRAQDADRHRQGAAVRQRGSRRGRRLRQAGLRRPRGLPTDQQRRHRRGVPARIRRHEKVHERTSAVLARRRHSGRVALSPRSDGQHPQIYRVKEESRERHLPPSAAQTHSRDDIRLSRLSGTGHADGSAAGRLFARGGGHAAPRDGQEKSRGHGGAAQDLPLRRAARTCEIFYRRQTHRACQTAHPRRDRGRHRRRKYRQRDLRRDGGLRQVRVQQVARSRLCGAVLSDRFLQKILRDRAVRRGHQQPHHQRRRGAEVFDDPARQRL